MLRHNCPKLERIQWQALGPWRLKSLSCSQWLGLIIQSFSRLSSTELVPVILGRMCSRTRWLGSWSGVPARPWALWPAHCPHCQANESSQVSCPLHCTALHCTALKCTALHYTALHCTGLHCTALNTIALHKRGLGILRQQWLVIAQLSLAKQIYR